MKARFRDLFQLRDGEWVISFTTPENPGKLFDKLREKLLNVEIKKAEKDKTLSQNAFMWALCSDIGKCLTPPLSKEDVYRKAIKSVGVYTQVTLLAWDVETVRKRWEMRGTGWFIEVVDDAKQMGKKIVNLYYGTSTYTVDELRTMIDWLLGEAEQLEISVPVGKERNDLYIEWGLQ